MVHSEPVCVFRPENEWRGELIVQHLRDHRIDAYLANRASVGLWGDGSLSFVKLEILVPQQHAQTASTLIDEFIERQPPPGPQSDTDPHQPPERRL